MDPNQELNLEDVSKEELYDALKELRTLNSDGEEQIKKLKSKVGSLIYDQKKRKNIMNILEQVGLDVKSETLEEDFQEIVSSPGPSKEGAAEESSTSLGQSGNDLAATSAAANDETQKLLRRMETQINDLKQKNEKAEAEKKAAIEARRNERLDREVMEKMKEMGCENPKHLLKLTKERYHYLNPDSDDIVGGEEYDPVPLEVVIGNLREEKEFAGYFRGSGRSGSGMVPASGPNGAGMMGLDNPFRKGGNATQAARLITEDPARARRLMAEAQAAGKMDPVFKNVPF